MNKSNVPIKSAVKKILTVRGRRPSVKCWLRSFITKRRTSVEVWHVVIKPSSEVRDIGVNSKGICTSTSIAPTDHAGEGVGCCPRVIFGNQRAATITLTCIL